MDFEKKYNDALFRASKFRVENPFDPVGQMVGHIFPELKDSEDERIKKEIIYILKGEKRYPSNNDIYEYIAYLEKQGKQKQIWEPSAAQLIVIKDLIEDKNTSRVNKVILRGMLEELEKLKQERYDTSKKTTTKVLRKMH